MAALSHTAQDSAKRDSLLGDSLDHASKFYDRAGRVIEQVVFAQRWPETKQDSLLRPALKLGVL